MEDFSARKMFRLAQEARKNQMRAALVKAGTLAEKGRVWVSPDVKAASDGKRHWFHDN